MESIQIPVTLSDLWGLLLLASPGIVEILKKVQEKAIPSLELPWAVGLVVKPALSAIVGAAIAWFAGLPPTFGAVAGGTGSVGYGIARPKPPKE